MIEKREFYIDGAWVPSIGGRDFVVIDPSTEEPCATVVLGSAADADAAVDAARRAFPLWAATPPAERVACIKRIVAVAETRREALGKAISMEMGAPIDLAVGDQAGSLKTHAEDFLQAFEKIEWLRPLGPQAPGTMIAHEPIGVVALITPWNWPIYQLALKVVPALLAGCTCVLKPSEESPLSAIIFAEICHEAGVPPGVFNLVNGDGAGVGSALSTHPDVEMVSFTGSARAGKMITRSAAETLKRVTLELGGKGANLVFADADENAVRRGVMDVMLNSGQTCSAPTRMLVERAVYDKAVAIAAEVANSVEVDTAERSGSHIGPVVNKRQWDQIQGYIHKGVEEGARLVAGGPGLPNGFNRGFYVKPTIFADVMPGMTIEREEIFGPVLTITPFDTEAEAVRIANGTPYGLANFVQSQDGARCNRLAVQLKSGMVEINGQPAGPGAFFGGIKLSGRAREGGVWGIEEFLDTKAISGWHDSVAK